MTRNRRFPRWSDIRPMIAVPRPTLHTTPRRLAKALTVDDLRTLARSRVPAPVFDFVDGAAGDEITARRSIESFRRLEFIPGLLADTTAVDLSTTIFGSPSRLPLILGPTGFSRLSHHEGELAVARAAAAAGVPYSLATFSSFSIEEVAEVRRSAAQWYQLYVLADRGLTREMIERAAAAGYGTLVLTIDTPVSGDRRRDVRNGFSIPPRLTPATLIKMARNPSWGVNLLTSEPLRLASFPESSADDMWARLKSMSDPSFSFAEISWVRSLWDGPLVVKGVLSVEAATHAVDLGADGVVLSNHGGRQLDRVPVPLELLPRVADRLGDTASVFIDSGVRNGADIAAAVALGATAALIGRPYLYGLMAAGERGVAHAISLFEKDLTRTLQLLGTSAISRLGREHVRLRQCACEGLDPQLCP